MLNRSLLPKVFYLGLAFLIAMGLFVITGCSTSQTKDETGAHKVRIGTLATEDFLPMWVAQENQYFADEGVEVEIIVFQSAQELSTALASNSLDGAMTDVPVAANLSSAGSPMTLLWITLGTDASQGKFGIMVGPNSAVTNVKQLANVPVGVGSGTMLEYVMFELMRDAGIPDNQIVKEEEKKLPVRFQLVMEGKTEAGVFPGSLLALGESQGGVVIIDDTQGKNLSQSVMAFNTEYATSPAGKESIASVGRAWDRAVGDINADPGSYRSTLVTHANLADPLKETYPIQTYPEATIPTAQTVDPVLDWMRSAGYITTELSYDEKTGAIQIAQ